MIVYKLLLLPLTLGILLTTQAAFSHRDRGGPVLLQRHAYLGECEASAPLSTYDRCTATSAYGLAAIACAEQDGLDQCRADAEKYNMNCNVASSGISVIASREFPGYRRCVARVRVYGYEKY